MSKHDPTDPDEFSDHRKHLCLYSVRFFAGIRNDGLFQYGLRRVSFDRRISVLYTLPAAARPADPGRAVGLCSFYGPLAGC